MTNREEDAGDVNTPKEIDGSDRVTRSAAPKRFSTGEREKNVHALDLNISGSDDEMVKGDADFARVTSLRGPRYRKNVVDWIEDFDALSITGVDELIEM
jgi:hypothetical protein